MSYRVTILSILAMCGSALAQPGRQLEIDAATHAAGVDLRNQVLNVFLAPGLTLRDIVRSDANVINIDALIAKAEPVGLPRWIGDDIVQVKLTLPGRDVVDVVKASSKTIGRRMSSTDFDRFKREWSHGSLQATGQAIPASRVQQVVATLQRPAWADVSDKARADVAMQARGNATLALVDQVNAIHLSPTQTVAGTFVGRQSPALNTWADALPATNIDLRDDRQIEIGVYVDKPGLNDVLKSSTATSPESEQAKAISIGISGLPDTVVGRAMLASAPATVPQPPLVIRELPAWANDPINADADAKFMTTQLRTARAAERSARLALRQKVLELKIDGGTTLSQHAEHEPAVNAAIEAAVGRARVYQVDYHADGSATVRVSLDPNDLLDALTEK